MDTDQHRAWLRKELWSCLRALASPGEQALATVPDGTCKADELALDFNNFKEAFVGNFGGELSEWQRACLDLVDTLLERMRGAANAALWTERAVCEHPRWAEVRRAAKDALADLGWDAD